MSFSVYPKYTLSRRLESNEINEKHSTDMVIVPVNKHSIYDCVTPIKYFPVKLTHRSIPIPIGKKMNGTITIIFFIFPHYTPRFSQNIHTHYTPIY